MEINVPLNSSVAANLISLRVFVLNINYHQCPLIVPLILASRFVLNINVHQCPFIIPYITTIHVLKHLSFKEKSYICILNKK